MNNISEYNNQMHKTGRTLMLISIILFFALPIGTSLAFGIMPPASLFFKSFIGIAMTYVPVGLIEVLTYAPMLGTGGTYLGFVTGNITTIKVPIVTAALKASGVEASTPEGDVLSTIAVAASSIVTTLVIALGMLLMFRLQPIIENPSLAPAFDNVIPALFGALGMIWLPKNIRLAWLPLLFTSILFIFAPDNLVSLSIPVASLIAIAYGRHLYKSGWSASV